MEGNNPHESRSTAAARREREMERKKNRERERQREREPEPARLRARGESCKLENFRAPIISDETAVRHQGSCPVHLDL